MAYNYYPSFSPYNNYQQYQQNFQQQLPQAQMMQSQQSIQQQPQIQNGGFVTVRSAQEAYNYPVAIGNSVTFKDETAPYIYVKTRGFSQLEEPIFEQFQLVKVDTQKQAEMPSQSAVNKGDKTIEYALKSDTMALWAEIEELKKQLADMTKQEGIIDG